MQKFGTLLKVEEQREKDINFGHYETILLSEG